MALACSLTVSCKLYRTDCDVAGFLQDFILQLLSSFGGLGASRVDGHSYISRRQVTLLNSVYVLMLNLFNRLLPTLHLFKVKVALLVWKVLTLYASADDFFVFVVHPETRYI